MVTLIDSLRLVFSIALSLSMGALVFSQVLIDEIELIGLKKTRPNYIMNELSIQKGEPLDSSTIQKDLQHLANLQLFSKIDYKLVNEEEKLIVRFYFEEKFPILPIINFGLIKEGTWFELGATDFNWRGRRYTLGFIYRYFERNSFILFGKIPYFNQSKFGLDFNLSKLSRTDPAYFDKETVYYDTDFYKASGHLMYSFRFYHFIFAGGGYTQENYLKNNSTNDSPGPGSFHVDKVQIHMGHYIEDIDYYYNLLHGYANKITLEKVISLGKDYPFHNITNEFRYFHRIGKNGNLAFRNVIGLSTHSNSPFAVYVLDNYINIRGIGDRVERGTSQWIMNIEYRYNFLEIKHSRLQALIFSDNGAQRTPGGKIQELFQLKYLNSYYGIGIRYYNHKVYNLTLRLDYGLNVENIHQNGFVLGVNQYF